MQLSESEKHLVTNTLQKTSMPKQLRMAHKLWLAVILMVVMLVAVVGFAAYRSAKVQG